jgi:hypothetical protein
MVPSWEGAAGSAGFAAKAENEAHNNIANPALKESSLRMCLGPLGEIIRHEGRL